ncbi:putative F-box domain-containing protein [Heracleum sosnowskyi]|uniref:F-box domain-containing protein n=1 Tax=Heracleum sosnowskyi TaxID=360622 RepID=A0AAD8JA56_9APIA|nr:putative F-box domain-containing protein [Heracleum sosnowskyi]
MGAKRGRTSNQLSLVSGNPVLKSSSVSVASNEDLLIQILLYVPIKTLMGFKSVSKQWLSLITNPHFVRLRNPLPSAASLFFASSLCRSNPDYQFIPIDVNGRSPTPFKTLDFVHDPLGSGISVLQSCNGLLLCASYRARESKRRYYVYNPTTKQFAILPQIRREYAKDVCGMSLAFDPIKSLHYKVVCVRRSEMIRQLFQIEIYSSETLLWRISGQPFAASMGTQFQFCTYWNGSIHWWGDSANRWNWYTHMSFYRKVLYRLYFKVDEERLEQLPMPMRHIVLDELNVQENEKPCFAASYIGESEGHWHIVEEVPKFRPNSYFTFLLKVYELARDYSGWFVKYEVDLNAIASVVPEIIKHRYNRCSGYTLNILSLVRSVKEEEDCSFLVVEIPGGKVVRYNFVDQSVEKLWEFTPIGYKFYDEDGLRRDCVSAFPYIESLACV